MCREAAYTKTDRDLFPVPPSNNAPNHGDAMNQTSETPLLPGMKPVLELLRTDPQRIDLVFCKKGLRTRDAQDVQQLCRQSGVRFSLVDQAALDRLCREAAQQNGNDAAPLNHQGVVARLTATDFRDLADVLQAAAEAPLPLVVALDQVQDPGNVGTLCRTLYAPVSYTHLDVYKRQSSIRLGTDLCF